MCSHEGVNRSQSYWIVNPLSSTIISFLSPHTRIYTWVRTGAQTLPNFKSTPSNMWGLLELIGTP